MNRTPEQWLELISRGESETVEFESRMRADTVVARDLTAFANTDGGTIIFGVGDGGEIDGLTDHELNQIMLRLERLAPSLFSWPCDYGSIDIDGKRLAFISVGRAPEHLAPVTTATGAFYVRRGSSTVKGGAADAAGAPQGGRAASAAREGQPPARALKAFVAMSFRSEEEPALVDYYRAMVNAVKRTGLPFELTRMDMVEGEYEISQKLMDDIEGSDLVIADFTLNPRNVYFELGYAKGRGKHVIRTARKDAVLEFDIRSWRTLFYRNASELEEKLIAALEAAWSELRGGRTPP
jgi:nucleoside 2-deoxyribosyltransferase